MEEELPEYSMEQMISDGYKMALKDVNNFEKIKIIRTAVDDAITHMEEKDLMETDFPIFMFVVIRHVFNNSEQVLKTFDIKNIEITDLVDDFHVHYLTKFYDMVELLTSHFVDTNIEMDEDFEANILTDACIIYSWSYITKNFKDFL